MDELSFKFVKEEGFKTFKVMICLKFSIPFRWTVVCDCIELYIIKRKKLKIYCMIQYKEFL